jgi:hypothetical protein
MFLRQSTIQTIRFGPFLDSTDGVTAETALTIAQADRQLSKDGAAFAQSGETGNSTHDTDGWYSDNLTAADTDTVGELYLQVVVAGALPVWVRWWVLEEAVYDAMYGASAAGPLQPTTAGRTLDIAATGEAGIDFNNVNGSLTGAELGVGAFAAGAINASAIATAAISSVTLATDTITASALATSAVEEIADQVWDEVLTAATHNVASSAGRRLRTLQEFQGYEQGAIWIDTVNGSAGTTDYENGTVENPVSTIADANTLATSLGIVRFRVAPGSSITFAASQTGQEFLGSEWTLALGGQDISNTRIEGATLSGVSTGTGHHLIHCEVGNTTLSNGSMGWCRFTGTITLSGANDYYWHDCYSGVAGGGTPIVDFGGAVANQNLNMRRYSGGIQIDNKNASGTDQMSLEGDGQLVVSASSGGAISIRGNFRVTNTGGATITYDDNSQGIQDIETDTQAIEVDTQDIQSRLPAALIGGRMDSDVEAINGNTDAADNLSASARAIVRLTIGTGSTTTNVVSDLTEATDEHYNGRILLFYSGALAGQATDITDYNGTTNDLTVTALTEAPANGDLAVIV